MNDPTQTGGGLLSDGADGEPLALVMDVGGTWIRVGLVTSSGDLLWKERSPTNADEGGPTVITRVETSLHRAISQAGGRRIAGIGVGIAGPVDPETGIMYSPPNNPGLDGVSFKALWKDSLEWPILLGNDATLAALGEYRYGAGVGAHTLVYITISTGIGGGIVTDGRPMMGAYGMAGELGHMRVDRDGPLCTCGHVGCLEALASGTSIAEMARRRLEREGDSIIMALVSGEPAGISAEDGVCGSGQGGLPS